MRRRNSSAACKRVLASRSRWPHPCVLPPKLGSADRLLSFGSIASEPGSRLRVHRYRRIAGQRESRGPSSAGSRTEQEQTDLARAGSVQNQPRAFVSRSVEARADLGALPLERGQALSPNLTSERGVAVKGRSARLERRSDVTRSLRGAHACSSSACSTTPTGSARASASAAAAPNEQNREARRRVEFCRRIGQQ